jgi:hypothetical protein
MTQARIDIPKDRLAALCRKWKIAELSLFGSVLSDDFRPDSDVDVLVDFQPAQTPGLAFFEMQQELSDLLGRRVDVITRRGLEEGRNWIRRRHILEHCQRVL